MVFDSLSFTLKRISRRPLRSFLTLLQMGLGVWVVAIVLTISLHGTDMLGKWDSLGKVYFTGTGGTWSAPYGTFYGFRSEDLLTLQEGESLENAFIFSTQGWWLDYVLANGLVYRVSRGAEASAGFFNDVTLNLVEGQFFTQMDQDRKNRVMLISEIMSRQMFPGQSALGKMVTLKDPTNMDWEYEIIGVYGWHSLRFLQDFFWVQETQFIIPLENWGGRIDQSYREIFFTAKPDQLYSVAADTAILFANRAQTDRKIEVACFRDRSEGLRAETGFRNLLMGFIAFVTILVSSVGVLSIWLVSTVERQREIGLRRCLGASRFSIVRLVLGESLLLSFFGSVVGLVAAFLTAEDFLSMLVEKVSQFSIIGEGQGMHPVSALVSVVLAVGSGLLSCLYPAIRAARTPVVEVLRD